MAETMKDACTPIETQKWHWYSVQKDLVEQGGLENEDIMINPLSVSGANCGGEYKGMRFMITWEKDTFLLLSSQEYIPELVDAFASVVGYKPFARYKEPSYGLVTVEWDKQDSERKYKELEQEGKLELTKLLE
ncbi:hypothetical protein GOV03_04545 [Candidatus Woesearchaeota archaeon]|nr:hypothetical protein [Candidatus Woesearchaeota archaeon]